MHLRTVFAKLAVIGLLTAVAPAGTVSAQTPDTQCSYGHARSLLEAFPPLFHYLPPQFEYPDCQYRILGDGEEVTFREGDWILAGNVVFWDYKLLGLSRDEAMAYLDTFEHRLWLAEVQPDGTLGPAVEQEIVESGYKDFHSPIFGHVIYKSVGAILQLEAGEYVSFAEQTADGDVSHAQMVVRVVSMP